jgi:hypothetical protein
MTVSVLFCNSIFHRDFFFADPFLFIDVWLLGEVPWKLEQPDRAIVFFFVLIWRGLSCSVWACGLGTVVQDGAAGVSPRLLPTRVGIGGLPRGTVFLVHICTLLPTEVVGRPCRAYSVDEILPLIHAPL